MRDTMRVLSVALSSILIATTTGCLTGRMLIEPVDLDDVDKAPQAVPLRAGIRSLVRADSNLYQATFEREIVRSLRASDLFTSVAQGEFETSDVDLVLHVGKADVSVRHHANLAGLPLAVLTLGIYMLVGAPVWTHEEFYEIPIRVESPGRGVTFEVVSKTKESHWLGLYSRESRDRGIMCPAPNVSVALNDLVRELAQGLRANRLAGSSGSIVGELAGAHPEGRSR